MKLKKITIKNYRSIKELSIDINDVSPIIFVGVNETGKSNLLKAVSLLDKDSKIDVDYVYDCNKKAQEASESISVIGEFCLSEIELKNILEYLKEQERINGIDESKVKLDKNTVVRRCYIRNKDNVKSVPFFKMDLFDELKENPLYKVIEDNIYKRLESFIKIDFWEPSDKFLITKEIDLNAFKNNTSLSIPLKNMFHLIGKNTDSEVKDAIDLVLNHPEKRHELEDRLSDFATKHITSIWKEHKIEIRVKTNGNFCDVNVYDKNQKYEAYFMQQRSDGFKQFISLILSISCQDDIQDSIILLDEPENHLHPSGVQYMREEIIRLGQVSTIFVSTHSIFFIDKNKENRHWVVEKKNKNCTEVFNVGVNKSIEDDEVMRRAFGIVYLRELLPANLYLVEGVSDKNILEFMIKKVKKGDYFSFAIKPAGGENIPVYAGMFMQDKIPVKVIVDCDEKGLSYIKKLKKIDFPMENVFDLKKLNNTIKNGATIEDLLPIDYVREFFENDEEINPQKIKLELSDKEPVFDSVVNQLNLKGDKNKDKKLSAKTRLANKFILDFSEKSLDELKNDVPQLVSLTENLIKL